MDDSVKKGRREAVQVILLAFLTVLLPLPGNAATTLQVILRDSRQVFWERPVSVGDTFFLIHRNSIYGSLVWESFGIDSEGSIWLEKIKTSSPAVLEYYGLEESSSGWISLSRKIEKIPMLITPLGEVRLQYGAEKIALSALLPEGTRIEIRIHDVP